MSTYVIGREIPGISKSTQDDFKAISQSSKNVLSKLSSEIKWKCSYVVVNKFIASMMHQVKKEYLNMLNKGASLLIL